MKAILLLITFNVFAMYEVKVKNNVNNKEFYGKFKTIEQVNEWIEDNKKPIKGKLSSWGKLHRVVREQEQGNLIDTIIKKEIEINDKGEEIEVENTYYVYSQDFDIVINDITDQENAKKAKKQAKKQAKKLLKDKLNSDKNLTLKEINELLRD